MTSEELRARIERLGVSQTEAAARLGLSLNGLVKQMRGERKVTRQTEIILDLLDELQRGHRQSEPPIERQKQRDRQLAQYLYPTVPRRK